MIPLSTPHIGSMQKWLAEAPMPPVMSTGCGILDAGLSGGIVAGSTTEVYGSSRPDRSALLIQTALAGIRQHDLRKRVLYLTITKELNVGLLRTIAGALTR